MRGLRLVAFGLALVLGLPGRATAVAGPRVYVVLIDGLGAEAVSEALTPAIWRLSRTGTFYPHARAAMPTVTNTNHTSVVTGVYPAAHGITANRYWNGSQSAALEDGGLIETETLFTVAAKSGGGLRTAGIFGKTKLAALFSSEGAQRSPDRSWGDSQGEGRDASKRPGSDRRVMDEMLRTISAEDPRFVFVNLADVDRKSHVFGPASPEAAAAIAEADRQIERLVAFLKEGELWQDAVLMLTADHGFSSIARSAERPHPALSFGNVLARAGIEDAVAIASGPIDYVYLRGSDSPSSPHAGERLKAVRTLALGEPGIAETIYRLPQPADGGAEHALDTVHPEWRLSHPRVGELILVARAGYLFSEPSDPSADDIKGSHGGPAEIGIPILIAGGYRRIRSRIIDEGRRAENPDLGMTAFWLLGLREPRFIDGRPIPARLRGRALVEAFRR